MSEAPQTFERPVQYVVSAVPPDLCRDADAWNLSVEWRGPGDLWAVKQFSRCLGTDGGWDWEPSPSNREDDWLRTHRFPLAEALRLAHKAAPSVCINGLTPADLIAKYSVSAAKED